MLRSYLLNFVLLFGCVAPMHGMEVLSEVASVVLTYPTALLGIMTTTYAIDVPYSMVQGYSFEKSINRATDFGAIKTFFSFFVTAVCAHGIGALVESTRGSKLLKISFLYGCALAGLWSVLNMAGDGKLMDKLHDDNKQE